MRTRPLQAVTWGCTLVTWWTAWYSLDRQDEAPPPPIVINKYSDEQLRMVAQRMKERLNLYKEKVIDQYASSPEITPPVTPLLLKDEYARVTEERARKAEEDRIKKEEADKKKKEEQEKKKKEAEQKKKEEEEKRKEEEKKVKVPLKTRLIAAYWASVDLVMGPLADRMDSVLGPTIDPFTDRRYIAWLSLVTVAINYNTWFITARMCFPYHSEIANPIWFTLDGVADVIYLLDAILFQPRKQFVKGGDIIKDRVSTTRHYRESERLLADVVSVLPFDLLYLQFGFKSGFRVNRLLKMDTFFEFSDRLESILAKAYIWRVIRTIGYLLFMLHLNACFYYVASEYQGIGGTKWVYSGLGSAYLRCYYFAVRSLINIGGLNEPHTVFEITFQMTNFFVGVFVFSSLIGQMRDVIGAATAGQTYFRSSMDNTVAYMVTNNIPSLVQNRVRTWYTYTWDAQGMLDESELLDKMPLVMRTAIAVDINLVTFQKIDLFKGCDQQMLVDMLLRLKSIIYLPGDFVVKKGDIGKEMYIIKSGAVQVVGGPDNSIVFVTLKAGCVFGEIRSVHADETSYGLYSSKDGGNRRTANVKAYGFANLFVLEKKDLFDILVHYPESQKVLARKGRKLMKAKGPAAAKVEEEKKKGLALFGPKPPTPKLLRAFGGNFNKMMFNQSKNTEQKDWRMCWFILCWPRQTRGSAQRELLIQRNFKASECCLDPTRQSTGFLWADEPTESPSSMFSRLRRFLGAPEPPPAPAAAPPAPPAPPAKEEKLTEKKDEKVEEPKATSEKKEEEKNEEKQEEQINEQKKEEQTTGPAPVPPSPAPIAPVNPEGAEGDEPRVVYSRYADDVLRNVIKSLRERTEILKEKSIDPYATSPEITPPVNRRYITWLMVVAVAYNYNVWFCPARLAFPYHNATINPFWIVLDVLSDVVNVIDIVVWQPRLQFVKAGDIIKDRALTKVHYRKSYRFKTDMVSVIPFDLLSLHFGFSSIYRFNRFLRVGGRHVISIEMLEFLFFYTRLYTTSPSVCLFQIESFFEFSDRLESIMAKAYIWRVARTTGYLLYMLHLNACAYYVASLHQGLASTTWVYDGKGTAYLRCYYFAVRSLINIGGLPEPVTLFEIGFQMTNFFVGVFVFSSLIGQMRDVIGAATAAQTYFRASMDGCVEYMNTYTIPKLVQNRVRTWYNYTWASQGMLDEMELLDKMPLVMRIAIAVDINLATFQKIQLFQGCDQQMLVDMLLRLKSIIYLPGDFVVRKGDIGKEMYIIKSGAVQVVGGPDNSIVFVTLKAGCVFGEISLLQSAKDGGNRRTANVRAYGFANLFVLEKKDLFDILVHYPESQKVLAKKGRQLVKAKAAAGAPTKDEKPKGLTLFGQKPPTPKLLKAFANLRKLKKAAEEEHAPSGFSPIGVDFFSTGPISKQKKSQCPFRFSMFCLSVVLKQTNWTTALESRSMLRFSHIAAFVARGRKKMAFAVVTHTRTEGSVVNGSSMAVDLLKSPVAAGVPDGDRPVFTARCQQSSSGIQTDCVYLDVKKKNKKKRHLNSGVPGCCIEPIIKPAHLTDGVIVTHQCVLPPAVWDGVEVAARDDRGEHNTVFPSASIKHEDNAWKTAERFTVRRAGLFYMVENGRENPAGYHVGEGNAPLEFLQLFGKHFKCRVWNTGITLTEQGQLADGRVGAGAPCEALEPGCDPLGVRAREELLGRLAELQDLRQHGYSLIRVLDASRAHGDRVGECPSRLRRSTVSVTIMSFNSFTAPLFEAKHQVDPVMKVLGYILTLQGKLSFNVPTLTR
ncbi:hypothetical protein CCH79_00016008 [Gambusia affinis]|uniref:Cyclic nucleotide-binding domain-containing protein n=1 Tax=Gambusia affinis TaxID=33528 RepID=A0A315VPH9_GAMAF|nr:hypothetical protein CCH79_00016008 [Gambusia affinis]